MVKTLAPPMVKYKQHMKERLNFVIGAEIPLTKQKDVQNTQEKVYAWEGGHCAEHWWANHLVRSMCFSSGIQMLGETLRRPLLGATNSKPENCGDFLSFKQEEIEVL